MADATPLWETTVYGPVRAGARIMKLDPGPMEKVNGVRYDVDRLAMDYRALIQNVPRERLEEMAVAIRKALPQCRV